MASGREGVLAERQPVAFGRVGHRAEGPLVRTDHEPLETPCGRAREEPLEFTPHLEGEVDQVRQGFLG